MHKFWFISLLGIFSCATLASAVLPVSFSRFYNYDLSDPTACVFHNDCTACISSNCIWLPRLSSCLHDTQISAATSSFGAESWGRMLTCTPLRWVKGSTK
jgi:hypothetical protein